MNDIMNGTLYVLMSIVIGAFIGGVTNHLAIKMLFHPRQTWRIGGRRVPFTPGLIPKRRDEIGLALGKVVSDYLVTTRGLSEMLHKPDIRQKIEDRLSVWIKSWTSREETVGELAARYLTSEQMERIRGRLLREARGRTAQGIDLLWRRYELDAAKLPQLVPGWSPERKAELVQWAAQAFTEELRRELHSPAGERLLKTLTGQLLEQTGGFLGTMAAIFMDEEKMVFKLRQTVSVQLESPAVRQAVAGFLERKIGELEEWTLADLLRSLTGEEDAKAYITSRLNASLPWEELLDRLSGLVVREAAEPYREALLARVGEATGWIIRVIDANIERIIEAVQLPKLVEGQVEKFPIERLEQIILSVSGKEFRAITWLGALLGGIIGLIQPILALALS